MTAVQPPELAALLDCPFCHGHRTKIIASTQGYHVWCNDCATRGPIADRRDLAATLWNTRPAPTPEAPVDEEAEKALFIAELRRKIEPQNRDWLELMLARNWLSHQLGAQFAGWLARSRLSARSVITAATEGE